MSRPTMVPSQLHASRTGTARPLAHTHHPPPVQNPTLSPSEPPPPPYERIQHVLLATAAASAQHSQSQPQSQQCPPPFPPRRPLRHQLPLQLAHQPSSSSFQQRIREFQTSPTSPTFLAPAPPSAAPITAAAATTTTATVTAQAGSSRIQTVTGTLLENSWRGLLDRFNGELAHVHALYVNALRKEQQEKEVFRGHCIRLKGERDVAREKLRRALGRQYDDGTHPPVVDGGSHGNGGAGTKSGWEGDGVVGSANGTSGIFPRSLTPPLSAPAATTASTGTNLFDPVVSPTEPSPPDLIYPHSYPSPTPSSPPSPQLAPPPPSPVATFAATALPTPSSSTSEQSSSINNDEPEAGVTCADIHDEEPEQDRKRECDDECETGRPSKRRRKHHHQCSAVLKTEGELPAEPSDTEIEHDPRKPRCSILSSEGDEVKPSDECDDGETTARTTPAGEPTSANPTRAPSPPGAARIRLGVNHVDLMYMPIEDKLVCRICAYKYGHARSTMSVAPKMFMRSATWEELTDHCERQHPTACEEVAGMGPGEVMELRQRMVTIANAVITGGSR